jgi:hypothetical protein
MALAEAYLHLWIDLFDVFLQYGFDHEDITFCIHEERGEIEFTLSEPIWKTIQESAKEHRLLKVTSLTTRSIGENRKVVAASSPQDMAEIQHAIAVTFQYLAAKQQLKIATLQEETQRLKREKSQRIVATKEEILAEAKGITSLLPVKNMFTFYRKGTYHLIVKLRRGYPLEFTGKTVSEITKHLEDYMAQ